MNETTRTLLTDLLKFLNSPNILRDADESQLIKRVNVALNNATEAK